MNLKNVYEKTTTYKSMWHDAETELTSAWPEIWTPQLLRYNQLERIS